MIAFHRLILMPIRGVRFVGLAILLVPLFSFQSVAAETRPDVRLVIDISGSMKKNDPNNLRIPAVNLLLKTLPEGSSAGVWTFGQYVNMLVPHARVNEQWRHQALEQARKINSAGQFTNIEAALEKAAFDWLEPDDRVARNLILLTDGMVDVSKDSSKSDASRQRILDEVLPRLRSAGVKIHAIALSENADHKLLRRLSVETDGQYAVAATADELLSVFLKVFEASVEQEQVPLEDNYFSIDSSIEEFTALVFRLPGSPATRLKMPNGDILSQGDNDEDVQWYHEALFDLVTVSAPPKGRWQLIAAIDPNNRVTVISDLKLQMDDLPANIAQGEKLLVRGWLEEQGEVITRPDFLRLMDVALAQDKDDGQHWEAFIYQSQQGDPPEDGIFSAKLGKTLLPGTHQITLLVDGKTFKRKRTHMVTVYSDLFTTYTETDLSTDTPAYTVMLESSDGAVDPSVTRVRATVTQPDGTTVEAELTADSKGVWKHPLDLSAGAGNYEVMFDIRGATKAGRTLITQVGPEVVEHILPEPAEPASPETDDVAEETAADDQADPEAEKPEDSPAEEPVAEEESVNWWVLGGVLALVNILLFGGGYLAYRKLVTKGEEVAEDTETDDESGDEK